MNSRRNSTPPRSRNSSRINARLCGCPVLRVEFYEAMSKWMEAVEVARGITTIATQVQGMGVLFFAFHGTLPFERGGATIAIVLDFGIASLAHRNLSSPASRHPIRMNCNSLASVPFPREQHNQAKPQTSYPECTFMPRPVRMNLGLSKFVQLSTLS